MTATEKNMEQRLRRALYKAGYALHKSRKPLSAENLGGYMILDRYLNAVVQGSRYELGLDEVTEFLTWVTE